MARDVTSTSTFKTNIFFVKVRAIKRVLANYSFFFMQLMTGRCKSCTIICSIITTYYKLAPPLEMFIHVFSPINLCLITFHAVNLKHVKEKALIITWRHKIITVWKGTAWQLLWESRRTTWQCKNYIVHI